MPNNNITLAYSTENYSGTDLVYATLNAKGDAVYQAFEAAELYPPKILKNRAAYGPTKRGYKGEHILTLHKEQEVALSSNTLNPTKIAFLKAFWSAPYKYMSLVKTSYTSPVWNDYEEVYEDGEEFPISYLEDDLYLPEVKMKLVKVNPEAL
jgi:hypothetical protein